MKAAYTRLTKLLGQPPEGIVFGRFVAELGCEPIIDPARYTFPQLGVSLVVVDQLFSMILIHIATPETRQGSMCRYEADLPNAINQKDGPETIEKKLSVRPFRSERRSLTGVNHKDFQDTYELPPFVLMFEFTTDPERLGYVAIGKLSTSMWASDSATFN
jgi:hypothetical protein